MMVQNEKLAFVHFSLSAVGLTFWCQRTSGWGGGFMFAPFTLAIAIIIQTTYLKSQIICLNSMKRTRTDLSSNLEVEGRRVVG